jgi:lysozyme family protein/peptidoglycan hydrolase-like protein with peptidoglycan-binding domain
MANLENLFQKYRAGYESNWQNMQIRHGSVDRAKNEAAQLLKHKSTYQEIATITGVPWHFIGLCHDRESGFDFNKYLGNGQPLNRVTTIVPKGRGPFRSFVDGAVDALRNQGLVGAMDWSLARTLFRLEAYNGFGYHSRGVNSPYLWSGSTVYGPPEARAGKFVADGVFDPHAVDPQLGVAVILRELMELDPSIVLDVVPPALRGSPEPDVTLAESVLLVQQSLNELGTDPKLVEDGILGPRTMAAISLFQQNSGLPDTGLLDAVTIAEISKRSAQQIISPATGQATLLTPMGATLTWPTAAEFLQFLQPTLQQIGLSFSRAATTPRPPAIANAPVNGPQVKALQTALRDAGYDVGAVDGIFGPLTRGALLAFQADNNIPTTGIVDAETNIAFGQGKQRPLSADRVTMTAKGLAEKDSRTVVNGQNASLLGWLATIFGGTGLANSAAVGIANSAKSTAPAVANAPATATDTLGSTIQTLETILAVPAVPPNVKTQLGPLADTLRILQHIEPSALQAANLAPGLQKLHDTLLTPLSAQTVNNAQDLVHRLIDSLGAAGAAVQPTVKTFNTVFDMLAPNALGAATPFIQAAANSVLPGVGGAAATIAIGLLTSLFSNRAVQARVDDHRTGANLSR